MTELNWDKINVDNSKVHARKDGESGQKQLKFIQLGKKAIGKEYVVRPVKFPVGYYKAVFQTPDNRWHNVVVEMDENGGDSHVRNHELYINHNVPFSAKYAVNVIDREDGELKILEGGVSIFEAFKQYKDMTEKSPGAREGADFKIEVTGKKGKDYYRVNKHANSVLSDEEVAKLKEEGLYDLGKIFKPTPEDKWRPVVAQFDGGDGQASTPASAPEPQTVAASTPSSTFEDSSDDIVDGDEPDFLV